MNNNEQLNQWADERMVELMVNSMADSIKNAKPVVYVVGSGMTERLSRALFDSVQVIIVDKFPEPLRQVDELLDYGPMFKAYAEAKEIKLGLTRLNEMNNNQVRNRNHGWYRQFDKNSKKRNLRG